MQKVSTHRFFTDFALLLSVGLLFIVVVLLLHLAEDQREDEEIISPGRLHVEIRWPDDVKCDVDLWVKSPQDSPVGYRRSSGTLFDLVRDDLGSAMDVMGLNFENAFTRGMLPGEYIVNVHLYRCRHPVPVKIAVSIREDRMKVLHTSEHLLEYQGHEITVVRLTFDDQIRVIDEHSTPIGLFQWSP